MQIPVNKNIDEYKDDFFKGLSLQQTAMCAAAVLTGTAAFLTANLVLALPQTVSLYAALPFALPFAAAGFLRIHGMSPVRYFRLKQQTKENPVYYFRPQMLTETKEKPLVQADKTERKKKKKLCLDEIREGEEMRP